MSVSNLSRWASIVLSLAFWAVGFIHLVAWFFIVFIYHANAVPAVRIEFLPIYGRLGVLGVWIFLVTVLLDFAAAVMLMVYRKSNPWSLRSKNGGARQIVLPSPSMHQPACKPGSVGQGG